MSYAPALILNKRNSEPNELRRLGNSIVAIDVIIIIIIINIIIIFVVFWKFEL